MSSSARFSVCREPRLNSLGSVWYCTLALALSIYIVAGSVHRFTRYMALPWPPRDQPFLELNAYVGCIGAAVVLLPFFVASAMLQVGNMANDGAVLEHDVTSVGGGHAVYENLPGRRASSRATHWKWRLAALWRHGGPTAPTLHSWSAFCLLLPRVLVHARLIRHGLLRKSDAWRTDLDFVLPHRDRLVVLSFMATINETELWDREAHEAARVLPSQLDDGLAMSAEFINYALALLVYSLRYPAVFWKSNKCFALLFSFYLVLSMAHKLLTFMGVAILYKVQVAGVRDVIPGFGPLFLGVPSTLFLYALYTAVLTLSGPVLYSYGLLKYQEWKARAAMRHHIAWKGALPKGLWGHGPHLYAFFVLGLLVLSGGPLVYDLTKVYCGSIDGVVLGTVGGIVLHLLFWMILWLGLTIKHNWDFSPESSTQAQRPNGVGVYSPLLKNGGEVPLLVVDHGNTYQVREASSKKAILSLATKFAQVSKLPHPSEDEDIYWLKPRLPAPATKASPDSSDRMAWLKGQRKMSGLKHKVTFEDKVQSSSPSKKASKSPKSNGRFKKQSDVQFQDALSDDRSDDGGDYATLREMSSLHGRGKDAGGSFYKSLCPLGDTSALLPKQSDSDDYELLLVDVGTSQVRAAVHGGPASPSTTLTPRSDCVSDTSTSPEKGAGSESSSSGVHSACSDSIKRASSLEQLIQEPPKATPWKSMSLQRNVAPQELPELVIRRDADPFGRRTNVRLTSFTDQPDPTRQKPSLKPTVCIAPLDAQRRDSANYSLASSGADSES